MKLWTSVSAALLLALLGTAAHAQILIGQSAGFSGPVAAGVKETTDGARLYLNAVNAKGASTGKRLNWSRWMTSSIPNWRQKTRAC